MPRESAGFRPSGAGWGLAGVDLDLSSQDPGAATPATAALLRTAVLCGLHLVGGLRMQVDRIVYPFYPVWRRRAGLASAAVSGHSPMEWPAILRKLWRNGRRQRDR